MSWEEANEEARTLLKELSLEEKMFELAGTMSGGQKRRLSLASSLIGSPDVVFLDEATTGLDPNNRNNVWKLLQRLKKDKTIILTTHSMAEAEALGDIVGVMSNGKIQAIDTVLGLKAKHGSGYCLSLVMEPNAPHQPIIDFVVKNLASAKVRTSLGGELTFSLSVEDAKSFPALFRKLDTNKPVLKIGK